MKGIKIPALKKWLADNRGLADRVDDGKLVADLIEHPGYAIVCEMAAVQAERGRQNLNKIATDVALSSNVQERIDFARRLGVQDAVSFFPDVIETIIDSAKTAAAELKADAEQAAAGGS